MMTFFDWFIVMIVIMGLFFIVEYVFLEYLTLWEDWDTKLNGDHYDNSK